MGSVREPKDTTARTEHPQVESEILREEYQEMATIAIAHWESQTAMIRYARELERHLDDRTIARARDAAELSEVDRIALKQSPSPPKAA